MGECLTTRCPRCGDKLFKMKGFDATFRCWLCGRVWREVNEHLEHEPDCPRCGTTLTQGLFQAHCKVCNPFQFEPCLICHRPRLFCYC